MGQEKSYMGKVKTEVKEEDQEKEPTFPRGELLWMFMDVFETAVIFFILDIIPF